MPNHPHPIAFFSHYAREDAKLSLSRQMQQQTGLDVWDIPGVKGLYVGDGKIVVATAEDHPAQGELIPTELKRPDYKGVPVEVQYQGYSYHLTGKLDHPDDARWNAYSFQGRRGGGGGGGRGGTVQGGSQIVCDSEYGTCGGIFVDSSNKQYLTCSKHVVEKCHGSVQIGSGNRDSPQGAGNIATVGKDGCSCGGGAAPASAQGKGWSEIGTYGLGAVDFDYATAYQAIFGRDINSIPYIGRRPLDHNFFQRGGGGGGSRGGGGRRGGRGGTFYLDDTANPLTGKGNESILGLGTPKGLRRAVMKEKLSYRGVRSGTTKTFPVTGLNYTDRGGICGTCTDMVVCYPCPLPGDSGASFWGTDGFLVAVVTDGSNDKGGNNCTSYNCSLIHLPECFGINVRNAKTPEQGPSVTVKPIDAGAISAQQKRLKQQQSYFGRTITVS